MKVKNPESYEKLVEPDDQHQQVAELDTWYGGIISLAGCATLFVSLGFINSFGIFLDTLQSDFNQSTAAVAAVSSVANGISSIVGIFAGTLSAQYGYRVVFALATICQFGSAMLSSYCHSFLLFFICYSFLGGLVIGLTLSPSLGAVSEWLSVYRTAGVGVVYAGSNLGSAVLPILAEILNKNIGWRKTFRYASSLAIVMALATILLKRRIKTQTVSFSFIGTLSQVKKVAKRPEFVILWLVAFFQAYGFFTPIVHLFNYSTKHDVSSSNASYLLSILGFADAVGNVLWGMIGDKYGKMMVLRISLFASGICLCLWPLCTQFSTILIFAIFVGFFNGGVLAAFPSVIASFYVPELIGPAISFVFTGWGLGSVAGPILTGALYDSTGAYVVPAEVGGAAFIFAMALTLTLLFVHIFKTSESLQIIQSIK